MAANQAQRLFGEVAGLAIKIDESDFLKSIPNAAMFAAVSYRHNYFEWFYSIRTRLTEVLAGCEQTRKQPHSADILIELDEFEKEVERLRGILDGIIEKINSEAIELDRVIRLFREGFLANVNLSYGLVVGTYLDGNWPLSEAVKSIRGLIPSYERAGATPEDLSSIAIAVDTLEVMYCE